jgi:hypothetical protein
MAVAVKGDCSAILLSQSNSIRYTPHLPPP